MLFKDDDDYLKKYYDLDRDGEIDDFERKIAEDERYYNWVEYNKRHASNSSDSSNLSYNYSEKPVKAKTESNKKPIIIVVCACIIILGILTAVLLSCHSKYINAVNYAINKDYFNAELELCGLIDELKFNKPSTSPVQNLWFFCSAADDYYDCYYDEASSTLEYVNRDLLPAELQDEYDKIKRGDYVGPKKSKEEAEKKSAEELSKAKRKFHNSKIYTTVTTTKNSSNDSYYYYTPKKSDDYYDVDEFADAEDFYDYYYDDFYDLEEAEDYYYEHS